MAATSHLCEHLSRVFIVEIKRVCPQADPYTLYGKVLSSSLLLSYGIRRKVAICIRLPQGWLVAHGLRTRRLYADESSSRGLVRAALQHGSHGGLRIEPSCIFATCCRTVLDLTELLSDDIPKDLVTPLCIYISTEGHEVVLNGHRIPVWYLIAIANIVLDRLGLST